MLSMLVGTLLSKGLPMLANSIIDMGEDKAKDFIKEKTGIDIGKVGSEENLNKALDAKMPELSKLDVEMEELRIQEHVAELNSELKLEEMEIGDVKDARTHNAEISANEHVPYIVKLTPVVIDLTIVFAFLGTVYLLFTDTIPEINKDMVYIMLGALGHHVTTVIGYYRGSSTGSKEKDKHIENLTTSKQSKDIDLF